MLLRNLKSIRMIMAIAFLTGFVVDSALVQAADLTIINHQEFNVYASSTKLELSQIYSNTEIGKSEPFEVINAKTGEKIPFLLLKDTVAIFYSLEPNERIDLNFQPVASWQVFEDILKAKWDNSLKQGILDNGLVKLEYKNDRWSLSFSGSDELVLIENNFLECWIDDQLRGRIMGQNPRDFGMISTSQAKIIGGGAQIKADGSVNLHILKSFEDYPAEDILWTEIYTLDSAKPVLNYTTIFENSGNQERFLAYVELGGGINGNYGNLLQVQPIVKKDDYRAPNMVLVDGVSNEFTRMGWRQGELWMGVESGSGCGIGFSVNDEVKKELLGSTVWDFTGFRESTATPRRFLVCLIDPEYGNFPYPIKADVPVETGLSFVASSGGVDIWKQSQSLFKYQTQGKEVDFETSYSVYLGDEPIKYGFAEVFELSTSKESCLISSKQKGSCYAALNMDISRPHEMMVDVERLNDGDEIVISVTKTGEQAIEILRISQTGAASVNFNDLTGWQDKCNFLLNVNAPNGSEISMLRIKPMPFDGSKLSSPQDKTQITDIATFFRWKGLKGVIDYQLQVADNPNFSQAQEFAVRSEIEYPIYIPTDKELPAAGVCYWRVRAKEPQGVGRWSDVWQFTVSDDHGKAKLVHKISPTEPLFTFESFRVTDYDKLKNTIPARLRRYTAFVVADKFNIIELLSPLSQTGQKAFLRTHHPHVITRWTPLAEVELAFQKYPNIIGAMGGEALTQYYRGGVETDYIERLIKLCAKYGRYIYEADGTYPVENKWEMLLKRSPHLVDEYGDYMILAQKNNILNRQFVSQSSVLGLYLSDMIAHQGSWEDGGWYWNQVGMRALGEMRGRRGGSVRDMPRIFWSLVFAMGVSRGCSVYSLDGQTGTVRVGEGYKLSEKGLPPSATKSAFWTTEGELTDVFYRYIEPFMNAVVDRKLIPDKKKLLEQIKYAVYNDGVEAGDNSEPYYREYRELYAGTYGFEPYKGIPGELFEFFPNTGRYFYIPVLPQGKYDLADDIKLLPLSGLQDSGEVRDKFNEVYDNWYEGNAFVSFVSGTIVVFNTNENVDIAQSYGFELNDGFFERISGDIEPHSYVLGKLNQNGLWLQANTEYQERNTHIVISMQQEPRLEVLPQTGLIQSSWDSAARELKLILDHTSGAVELEIKRQ